MTAGRLAKGTAAAASRDQREMICWRDPSAGGDAIAVNTGGRTVAGKKINVVTALRATGHSHAPVPPSDVDQVS